MKRHYMFAIAFPVFSDARCVEDVPYEDIRRGVEKRLDYLMRNPDQLLEAAGWFEEVDDNEVTLCA